MRILYAIQGTGNGHLSRARDIIPLLQQKGDLDILVSGTQADIKLPYPVTYTCRGLSFIFGKKGGIDLLETYKKSNLRNLFTEINQIPIDLYDLVINDFEPVSAWACYMRNKECISLSHQAAILNKKAPQPKHIDIVGKTIFKNYAPVTARYGFHFKAYDNHIYTPVIRTQIRNLQPVNNGHYTVYLPAYGDKRIIKVLGACKDVRWDVFSKHSDKAFSEKNISIYPINNEHFIQSMASSAGVLCGAGFETPAEALHLQKKLMVIPMKNQFEQHCNAAALKELGIPVLKSLKTKYADKITSWLESTARVSVHYPDETARIIETIFHEHTGHTRKLVIQPGHKAYTIKKFREISLKNILTQLAG